MLSGNHCLIHECRFVDGISVVCEKRGKRGGMGDRER